jgi:hypothetical protein
MEYKRPDINAMFTANTAVHGEVVQIEIGGRKVPMKVTVKLRKESDDIAYSLVNNEHIEAQGDPSDCQQRTYTVRQGLYIEVLVKNLHDEPVQLRSTWCDDHETHAGVAVTMQPQSEHTLPMPLRLEAHETKNKWNLFFAGQPLARLVLVFIRNEDGEQTIRELLYAMQKVVDAYK